MIQYPHECLHCTEMVSSREEAIKHYKKSHFWQYWFTDQFRYGWRKMKEDWNIAKEINK